MSQWSCTHSLVLSSVPSSEVLCLVCPHPLKSGPRVHSVPGVNVLCERSPERAAWWGMAPTTQPPQEPNSGEPGGTLAPGSRTTGFAFLCLAPLPPGSVGDNLVEPRPRCICLESIQFEVVDKQTTSEQPETGELTLPSEPGGGFARQTAW